MLNNARVIESQPNISDNISALPAGIIRHPEPLSNNHYILTSGDDIAPAGEITWRILQNRIASKDPDKPLVIAAFEEHTTISHILAKVDLLTRFANHQKQEPNDLTRNIIYGDETPYNLLSVYAKNVYGVNIPEKYKYEPSLYDPDNHILMNSIITRSDFSFAPQTNNILYKTCMQHGIVTCFNDAADTHYGAYLDPNDTIVKEIAEKHKIDLSGRLIDCEYEDGMFIRNEVMAKRILEKAKENEVDIVMQSGGRGHGGNKTREELPYEKSYLKSCRNMGAEVTSIFYSLNRFMAQNIIPDQALKDDPDMIIIDGIPEYKGFSSSPLREYIKCGYLKYKHTNPHLITPDYKSPSKKEMTNILLDI